MIFDVLSRAVGQVFDHQTRGDSAVDSVIKTAEACKLLPEQIMKLTQIVNRSSVNAQRLHEANLEEKLATAEVVDPDEVIRRVYGCSKPEPKVASFTIPLESSLYARAVQLDSSVKTASAAPVQALAQSVSEPESEPKNAATGLYHGLYGPFLAQQRHQLECRRKEAELEISRLTRDANRKLAALQWKLASYPAAQQVALVDQARYHFAETNPLAEQIVLELADDLPMPTQAKLAFAPVVPDMWDSDLFDGSKFASAVESAAKQLLELPAKIDEQAVKIATVQAHLELIDSSTVDDRVDRIGFVREGTFEDVDNAWVAAKVASLVPMIGAAAMLNGQAQRSKSDASTKAVSDEERFLLQLRAPQHEASLASVRARTALHELMNYDPIIRAYPPDKVIGAFNELSQYSPRTVEHTAPLRAGLRTLLTSNTSSFDLDQIRKSER